MQLVEINTFQMQPSEARLTGDTQVLGARIMVPTPGRGPRQPALGGDYYILAIRVQCLVDQLLAHFRSIGIGGIDQLYAKLHGPAQQLARPGRIGRLAPDAGAGDAHGAEAHAIHRQVAAQRNGSSLGGRR